jgi:hypothetical protein
LSRPVQITRLFGPVEPASLTIGFGLNQLFKVRIAPS